MSWSQHALMLTDAPSKSGETNKETSLFRAYLS